MSSLTTKVTEIGIAAILTGALIPVGLSMLSAANTTGWTDTQVIMWGVVKSMKVKCLDSIRPLPYGRCRPCSHSGRKGVKGAVFHP